MTADLHTHSTASDGELSPTELVAAAHAAGITVLALTDHDTVAGIPAAVAVGAELGVEVIAGCEFSVRVSWGEMHLLGYFLPTTSAPLAEFLSEQRESRRVRAEEIVNRLQTLGVDLDYETVAEVAGEGAFGRPHVARALVQIGAVSGVDAAFHRYLGFRKPAFVPKQLPKLTYVTDLVKSLGALTSAAHLKDRVAADNLGELKAGGVDAIEVMHPSHDANRRVRISTAARNRGFLQTGGSDWHSESMAYAGGALGEVDVPQDWLDEIRALHQSRNG